MRLFAEKHNSFKWDNTEACVGNADAIPMWVADTDFVAPEPICKMLEERVRHGIFGYPYRTDVFRAATKRWILKQHNVELQEEWMVFTTGVVPIFYTAIEAFTAPGDEIIIQHKSLPGRHQPRKRVWKRGGAVCAHEHCLPACNA